MIQLFPEFVIQELQELLSIIELNNVLNSTVILKEYKKKYYHWTITSKRGDFRKNYNKIGANFSKVSLQGTNFTNADLTDANFTGAIFAETNFTNANLTNAIFIDTISDDSIFENADLTDIKFKPKTKNQQASLNLRRFNLTKSNRSRKKTMKKSLLRFRSKSAKSLPNKTHTPLMKSIVAFDPILLKYNKQFEWINEDYDDNIIIQNNDMNFCMKRSDFDVNSLIPYTILQKCDKNENGDIKRQDEEYIHLLKFGITDSGIIKTSNLSIFEDKKKRYFKTVDLKQTIETISSMLIQLTNYREINKDYHVLEEEQYDKEAYKYYSPSEDVYKRGISTLNFYVRGNGSNVFNAYIYREKYPDKWNKEKILYCAKYFKNKRENYCVKNIKRMIKNLDDAITTRGEISNKSFSVFRGTSFPNQDGLIKGYLSTTTMRVVARSFMYRAKKKTNVKVTYLYEYIVEPGVPFLSLHSNAFGLTMDESELLLPRGLISKVLKTYIDEDDENDPIYHYTCSLSLTTPEQYKPYNCKKAKLMEITPSK